jgi:RNA polymerase subunit RPABC4/transcription elongation factor Spt4
MENRKSEIGNSIDPGHSRPLALFRVLGPIILGLGALLIVISMIEFFSLFGSMQTPRFLWMPFLGIPMLFVGGVLSQFGYAGKVARFMAQEMAPVGKDTFNYMADGTQEGIKTVATAVGQGLGQGMAAVGGAMGTKVTCRTCKALVDAAARFCPQCGGAMTKDKPCPNCKHLNDTDAKFCDNCGQTI